MRIIVYGLGAIGGTVAVALHAAGQKVLGIARGAHLDAIREQGLLLRAPQGEIRAPLDVVAHPSEIAFGPDDIVLLTMKTQDTWGALLDLRNTGLTDQPIFCLQNGVENERMALRLFPSVHGATIMLPAGYDTPGEVTVFGAPRYGIFDLGRYPQGHDAVDAQLAAALEQGNIAAFTSDRIMVSKYGKLRLNLVNILVAALGQGAEQGDLPDRIRAEAVSVYAAAGIDWADVGHDSPRRKEQMIHNEVAGRKRIGNSTLQSVLRGAPSLETDYLNGEIVRLGRMHGVGTPLNLAMSRLAHHMLIDGIAPGALTLADIEALVGG